MCLSQDIAHIAIVQLIPGTKTFTGDEYEAMIGPVVYVCSALRSVRLTALRAGSYTEEMVELERSKRRCMRRYRGGWPQGLVPLSSVPLSLSMWLYTENTDSVSTIHREGRRMMGLPRGSSVRSG